MFSNSFQHRENEPWTYQPQESRGWLPKALAPGLLLDEVELGRLEAHLASVPDGSPEAAQMITFARWLSFAGAHKLLERTEKGAHKGFEEVARLVAHQYPDAPTSDNGVKYQLGIFWVSIQKAIFGGN